jgi:UDP-sugar pyrophosphorylase
VKNALADGVAKQASGNAPEVGATGEADMYLWGANFLSDKSWGVGCDIQPAQTQVFKGIKVDFPAHIVLAPSVGTTREEIASKFPGGPKVRVSNNSTLVLDGENIKVNALDLNGTLVIHAVPGANVTVDGLKVQNKGWSFEELKDGQKVDQKYEIRGYQINRGEQAYFKFSQPGDYTLNDQTREKLETKEYNHPARRF